MGRKRKKILRKSIPKRDVAPEAATQVEQPQPARANPLLKVTTLKSLLILIILGLVVFATGLANNFVGDDLNQIVYNPAAHSLSNVATFFQGSTFYNGPGQALDGHYYRPLMMTAFSLLYTFFGPTPFAFHLAQLLLHILATFILFLILRYFFKPALALALSIVFLVHPINSQAVFSIAAMQEPLFMLFGLLGFWTLLRFHGQSARYLILTVACLFLSLLAKESGVLFVGVSLLYVYLFDRKRLYLFIGLLALPLAVYAILRLHALGPTINAHNSPIDELPLWGRLLNVPAIVAFYLITFIAPLRLAHAYHWSYTSLTFSHFILPLFIVIASLSLLGYAALALRRRQLHRHLALLLFFTAWLIFGLAIVLQVAPLDFTVCETWFYFPIVGILGVIGVLVETFPTRMNSRWVIMAVALLVALLSARTAMRGLDWRDDYTLASHDIVISEEDYNSEKLIAFELARQGKFDEAKYHAERSVAIYGDSTNYDILGRILTAMGDYPDAQKAFSKGLRYPAYYLVYEDRAALTLVYGGVSENRQLLNSELQRFPHDGLIWFDLAVLEQNNDNNAAAKVAILAADKYGQRNTYVYQHVLDNEPMHLDFNLKDTAR